MQVGRLYILSTDMPANHALLQHGANVTASPVFKLFFGYFDPENIFIDNENK